MGIVLKVLLLSYLRILAPQFEQLPSAKIFWGFAFECQYHQIYS